SDLTAHTTSPVSVTPDGHVGNGRSNLPVFSPDGNRLAFLSTSTNLTAGAPAQGASQGNPNLFVRDLTAQTTTLISATPDHTLSTGNITQMVFSPDGQSLAF